MARVYDGSTQYATGTSPVTSGACSLFAWAYLDGSVDSAVILQLVDSDTGHGISLEHQFNDVVLIRFDGTTTGTVYHSTQINFGSPQWYAIGASIRATDDAEIYLDGVGGDEDTTDTDPTVADLVVGVNAQFGSFRYNYLDGAVTGAAVYSTGITDDDHAALAQGKSPLSIRRAALAAYAPMMGRSGTSPEKELVARNSLTLTGGDGGQRRGPSQFRPYPARLKVTGVGVTAAAPAVAAVGAEEGSLGSGSSSRIFLVPPFQFHS